MPTFLSLFAGIGGFDLGLERAGWRSVGQVELDPFCRRVLAARFPGVERAADVRTVYGERSRVVREEGSRLRDGDGALTGHDGRLRESAGWHGGLALLVGGFPCQDLSVAGKRAGLSGERSGLFWEIVRIATALKPTWGLFENVPGLLSSHSGRDFWLVLQGLRECWPAVGYRILDSQHFGVAQRRRRVFLVCGPSEERVAAVLALAEGGAGDLAAGDEAGANAAAGARVGVDLAGTLGSRTANGGMRTTDLDGHGAHIVKQAISAKWAKGTSGPAGDKHHNLVAPLSADADKGDQDPLVFESRFARNGRGAPGELVPPLKAESGETGKGDGAPLVAFNWQSGGDCRINPQEEKTDSLHSGQTPAIAYRKAQKAHDPEDGERWEEAEQSDTLAGHGTTTSAAVLEIADTLSVGANQTTGRPGDLGPAIGSAVRRLTPVECERLQAFPDGWTCLCQPLKAYAEDPDAAALRCTCPDSARYRALGNAVTVSVIEELGRRLMEAL